MSVTLFTLKEYLNTQKKIQESMVGETTVPTMDELAEVCEMKSTPFSRMINNHTDAISKTKLSLIIAELRKRGLKPTFDDLFAYYE